jgi:hypothetical protein
VVLLLLLLLLPPPPPPPLQPTTRCTPAHTQLLTSSFTAPEVPLRLASFQAWHCFMGCCAASRALVRKKCVLLRPITYALQHSSSAAVHLAAVGTWARLLLLLLGRQQLLWVCGGASPGGSQLDGDGELLLCAGPGAAAAAAAEQERGDAAAECAAGVPAAVLDGIIKPVLDLVMGCCGPVATQPAAAAPAGNSSNSGKDTSCLEAAPVVQFVLQQVLSAQQQAGSGAAVPAAEPHSSSGCAGTPQQQQQQQHTPLSGTELAVRLLQLVADAACGSMSAQAVLRVAAGAAAPAAAAAAAAAATAAGDTCSTPAAAAPTAALSTAGAARTRRGALGLFSPLQDTPPPDTPCMLLGRVLGDGAAAGGDGFTPAGLLQLRTPATGAAAAGVRGSLTPPPSLVLPASKRAPAEGQSSAAAAEAAAGVLGRLPGWLQVAMAALQLLLPPQGAATGQHIALPQAVTAAWLPAWQGLMQQLGAALLVLQHQERPGQPDAPGGAALTAPQQQQQQQHQQQQQRQASTAINAAVQCVCALGAALQVSTHVRGGTARLATLLTTADGIISCWCVRVRRACPGASARCSRCCRRRTPRQPACCITRQQRC